MSDIDRLIEEMGEDVGEETIPLPDKLDTVDVFEALAEACDETWLMTPREQRELVENFEKFVAERVSARDGERLLATTWRKKRGKAVKGTGRQVHGGDRQALSKPGQE